jgi:hypothetical protein
MVLIESLVLDFFKNSFSTLEKVSGVSNSDWLGANLGVGVPH